MGGYNERIEKPEEIIPAIRRCSQVVASGQPALLEIITKHEGAFSHKAR